MKSTYFALLFCLLFGLPGMKAQTFSNFLNRINAAGFAERQAMAGKFLADQTNIPIIESDTTAHFLYWGNAISVSIAGDATAWKPAMNLKRIEGCDLWYLTASYEPDAHLEYKVVVNGNDWKLDSLNKLVVEGGMGKNSEFVMPRYERPQFIYERDVVPWGFYFDTIVQSEVMKESRKIRIYLPPNYEKSTDSYPVAYFHDGFEFFDRTAARNIMDNMTFEKRIRPVIAVFVEPVHRDPEYSGMEQSSYTRFMVEELIPFMDKGYRTQPNPEGRAQFGISNGGNIALWLAASHPEAVGKAAAFSSNVESNILKKFEKSGCKNQKIYLDLGIYDLPMLLPKVQKLKLILDEKGCDVFYHEYPEGHNWAFWQKHLPDALEYFFH